MTSETWLDPPTSPEQWIGKTNRIKSFFNSWWLGTPRAKVLLLYGNPGCGKTSSVYAFRGNASIIHKNCSSEGGIKKMEGVYEIVQSPTDIDGNNVILLLDEIEGLTHKSMELMTKIIKTTKIPIVMTCNMSGEEVSSKVRKYKWGTDIDIFEVVYPEHDVVERLIQIAPNVKLETLEQIVEACNSVRSAILTLHHYVEGGKERIIPVDIRGSEHEQIKNLLTGKGGEFKIDYNRFLSYCLSNRVPAIDVENYILLNEMSRRRRLAGVDEKFRNLLRAENDDIRAPRVRAKPYVFRLKDKEKNTREEKGVYKKSELGSVVVRKKVGTSIDDLW